MKRSISIVIFIVATCIVSLSAMEPDELKNVSEELLSMNDYVSLTETTLDMIQEQKRAVISQLEGNERIDSLSDHIKRIYQAGQEIFSLPEGAYKNCTRKDVCKVCLLASGAGLGIFGILSGMYAAVGECTGLGAKFACNPGVVLVSLYGGCGGCSGVSCFHGYKYLATRY